MIKYFCVIALKNIIRNRAKNILYLLLITFIVLTGLYSLEVYTATKMFMNESVSAQSDHDTESMIIFVSRISLSFLIISAVLFFVSLFVFSQNKLSEDKNDLAVLRAIGYKNIHLFIISLMENGVLNISGYILGVLLSSVIFYITKYYIKMLFNIELVFQNSSCFIVLLFQVTVLLISNFIAVIQFKLLSPITILKE